MCTYVHPPSHGYTSRSRSTSLSLEASNLLNNNLVHVAILVAPLKFSCNLIAPARMHGHAPVYDASNASRIRSDSMLVFSMKKNLRACRFTMYIFQFSRGAQAYSRISKVRTLPYLYQSILLETLYSRVLVMNNSTRNPTVRLAKWGVLVQMSILLFSKSYGKSLQKIF
jgi:hypothetical protein